MKPTDALPHPTDWGTTTVARDIEIKRGISWSKEQEHAEPGQGRVPVIRIGNVQQKLELDDLLYLSGIAPAAIGKKRVSAGWSAIVGSNGNRNRVGNAVLVKDGTDFLFASFLLAACPITESNLKPKYFYRWLTSEQVQAYLSASSEGTTGLNNLSHSFFRSMAIPVPSQIEQKSIAYILDAVDKVIEQTQEAVDRARALQISLIADSFDHQRGAQKKLAEYITDIRYGTSQAAHEKGWGNPTLRIPNVVADDISYDELTYVNAKPADVTRLKLIDGDLLLVRTNGNPNYVGRSAVFKKTDDRIWLFASYLIRVRLDSRLKPDYVNIFLGTERGRRELLRRVTTSAGNHNINANSIRLIKIPVPESIHEQDEIIQIGQTSRTYTNSFREKLFVLEQLKKALVHDLLTGKVRVNHAIDKILSLEAS